MKRSTVLGVAEGPWTDPTSNSCSIMMGVQEADEVLLPKGLCYESLHCNMRCGSMLELFRQAILQNCGMHSE